MSLIQTKKCVSHLRSCCKPTDITKINTIFISSLRRGSIGIQPRTAGSNVEIGVRLNRLTRRCTKEYGTRTEPWYCSSPLPWFTVAVAVAVVDGCIP